MAMRRKRRKRRDQGLAKSCLEGRTERREVMSG
jgi:hypothetical protein